MPEKRIQELTTSACLDLLRDKHFGRLSFMDAVGDMPLIIPVNYLLLDDKVVFRTDAGSKLAAAMRGAPVAFEVDGLDEQNEIGWSVVVRGHAEQVTEEVELARLRQTPLRAWAPGAKPHYVRIDAQLLSGRRISLVHLPSHWWG